MGCPSMASMTSSSFDISPVPIYTPGYGEAHWKYSVLPKNSTQRSGQVSNPDLSTQNQCINRPTIITPGENGMGPLITLCSPKTGQGDESRSLSRASISGRHQKEESTLLCDMPRDQRVKGDKVKLTPFLLPWTWANLGRTRVCMPPPSPPPLLRLPNFSWDCTKITPSPQQYFGHLFLNALDLWPPREKGCIKTHWSQ